MLGRMLGFLFGCGAHGITKVGVLDVISRCTLRTHHRGPHRFLAAIEEAEHE